jgi:acylpyruvate hydrolase
MRLTTVRNGPTTSAGRIDGDRITLLPWRDLSLLLAHPDWRELAAADGESIPLEGATLDTLLPFPDKIICLGLNYESHILEMGRGKPEYPTLFAKYRSALIGPNDPIHLPSVSEQMDWEVELAVVIGKAGRNIPESAALDHIAGYTILNDVTARDWQSRTLQFLSGKTFEGTTPVGPMLVTSDELPTGGLGVQVRCEVNGQVMQDGNTSDLCFTPAFTVAYISQILTLLPGDIIAMGTPGGVGHGRIPPVYLQPGDVVRTSIAGIGEMVNLCLVGAGAERPVEAG